MLDPKSVDFKQIGFHAGLEVHHQIRSSSKLFCRCPPTLEKNPRSMDYSFHRNFRPVLGEMGDFDPGMLVEFEKGYKVTYYACEQNTCTYEMDETPPFLPDMEAVEKGFILALYFNCSALAEEIVVNRKQYLDGSITTGFQRTFIIGRDGWVPVFGKKVRVTNVHVEEDAARRVDWNDTASRNVFFNLDRLGFPLVEVITNHCDVETPDELVELARQIGRVLRISCIGRRGIGVVRQDINISIAGGNRVEIKGVQDLGLFDILCRNEAVRQKALIEIGEKMKKRGIRKEDFEHTYVDISHLFSLEKKSKAFAAVFPKMKGLFGEEVQPNKDFGLDVFEKSMLITGIPRENHFHSDEYRTSTGHFSSPRHKCRLPIEEKYSAIRSILKPKPDDAFVVIVGPERRAIHALKKIVERTKMALDGVPQETRRFLPNGNTEFLRVIHGKERIYPDTDTPPIVIPEETVQKCMEKVGRRPWEVYSDLRRRHNLNQCQVDILIRDEKVCKFYDYTEKLKLKGSTAYHLLIELDRSQRRKRAKISDGVIDQLAVALSRNLIVLEQIASISKFIAKQPDLGIKEVLERFQISKITDSELDSLIFRQMNTHDLQAIIRDKTYRKKVIPKMVGEILDLTSRSIPGSRVLERIHRSIAMKEMKNVKR